MTEFTNVTGIQNIVYPNSLSYIRIFKLEHSLEPYFFCVTNKALRDVFIRFRMGIFEIKTHKLR